MRRLIVVGGGFAGVRAAQAAARLAALSKEAIAVSLIAPDPELTLRPALYSAETSGWTVPLGPSLTPLGARLLHGSVVRVLAPERKLVYVDDLGVPLTVPYDSLVLATGSALVRPDIPGASRWGFDIDTAPAANRLLEHLRCMDLRGRSDAATVVVVGAGFTGLEFATELRLTLGKLHDADAAAAARIVVVDRNRRPLAAFGGAAAVIENALDTARIETRFGCEVALITQDSVTLSDGEAIPAATVVLAGGFRAQGPDIVGGAPRDGLGRLKTDDQLQVLGLPGVFAAGDAAHAILSDDGRVAPMSCQHAMTMGDVAGENAARFLVGEEPTGYRQPYYVTCLDLGAGGAVFSEGWDRKVALTGDAAKAMKRRILAMIRPPAGAELSAANPPAPRSQARPAVSATTAERRPAVTAA